MLIDCLVWLLCGAFGAGAYWWLVKKYSLRFHCPNFRGDLIPNYAGIVMLLAAECAYIWFWREAAPPAIPIWRTAFITIMSLGFLGLADDLYGNRRVGGLRGHFNELFRNRRLTTGAIKAIGGGAAAIGAGLSLHATDLMLAMLTALLIALSANSVNLTDTRPGRCLTVSLFLGAFALLVGYQMLNQTIFLAFVVPLLIALALYLFDSKALLMIGDVGSNSIGGLIGLLWAAVAPVPVQIVYLAALVWFHWWTESHSLSKTIEKTLWLKQIDSKIGVRG